MLCTVCATTVGVGATGVTPHASASAAPTDMAGYSPAGFNWGYDDYFAITGTDHAVWLYNGSNHAWTNLGGYATSGPGAVVISFNSNFVYVFVRGSDAALYYKQIWNGGASSSAWISLGGGCHQDYSPAAYSYGGSSSLCGVAVVGTDHHVYYRAFNKGGSWAPWTNLGGYATSGVGATTWTGNYGDGNNNDNIIACIRGGDGALWAIASTNGGSTWNGWTKIGGGLYNAYTPTVWFDIWRSALGFAAVGTNQHVYYFNGTVWKNIGGTATSGVSAFYGPQGNLAGIATRGTDGHLYDAYTSSAETSWTWERIV